MKYTFLSVCQHSVTLQFDNSARHSPITCYQLSNGWGGHAIPKEGSHSFGQYQSKPSRHGPAGWGRVWAGGVALSA